MIPVRRATSERVAMEREVFEAAHVLDRHPIPVDPDDDDATAAARIAIDRLGLRVVAPLRAKRDAHAAILAVAESSRAIVRRIALGGRWNSGDHGPLVAFTKVGDRPVALIASDRHSGYDAIDPRAPRVIRRVDDVYAQTFGDVAYAFAAAFPHEGISFFSLFAFGLRDSMRDIGRVAALGLLSIVLASAVPLAIRPLLESVLPAGLRGVLVAVAGLLTLTVGVGAVADIVRNFSVVRTKARFGAKLQRSVLHRLIGHSPAFFRRYSVADVASRALGVDEIELYVSDAALTGLLTGVFSLVSFLIVLAQDVAAGIVCAILAALTIGAFVLQASLVLPLQRELRTRSSALSAFVHQTITGIAKIRAAAAVDRMLVRWTHRFLIVRRFSVRMAAIDSHFAIFATLWPAFSTLCVIVTVIVVHDGAMSPGTFFTILAAYEQLLAAVLVLGANVASIVTVVPIYERLKPILDERPERPADASDPGPLAGKISLRGVSFTYEGASRPALEDVDLTIEPGSFVAVVGPSGSGKSTLLRLLLGFERPSAGTIAYDSHDFASLDVVAVRRQIGTVLQTAMLLPGSIFENIAGNAIITRDQAWDAARRVGIADDIEAMPMKLETVIGANGGGLSGGQRQRIVIARAIVVNPSMLFLDEATSALDNVTQGIVNRNLARLDATRIVIAHRLSTVIDADRIIVMKGGRIVEDGTYETLIAADGLLAELALRQQSEA